MKNNQRIEELENTLKWSTDFSKLVPAAQAMLKLLKAVEKGEVAVVPVVATEDMAYAAHNEDYNNDEDTYC